MANQPLPKDHPLRGKKIGAWSKYGGARQGLVREDSETWNCQGCAEELPNTLPGYMFEFLPNEYVKLCSACQNTVKRRKITRYVTLTRIVRTTRTIFD
jgi:hypothetical protein